MDETRARQMVEALRGHRVIAHVERAGVYQFGVRVRVDHDRYAVWDSDGTAGLEAQVLRNGVLVGFVPTIPGSEDYSLEEAAAAIAGTDYDAPISTKPAPSSAPGAAARPAAAPRTPPSRNSSGEGFLSRLFGRR